jgi:hypothetical protein
MEMCIWDVIVMGRGDTEAVSGTVLVLRFSRTLDG